jgi:hypothetical protein
MTVTTQELEALAIATGSPNQRERFAAGVLPEDELLGLARVQLFKEFAFPRWTAHRDHDRMKREIKHKPTCGGASGATSRHAPEYKFEACDLDSMTADEWRMFKLFTIAAGRAGQHMWLKPNSVLIDPVVHFVECASCGAEDARTSIKISIHWAGRVLVREYALDPVKYLSLGGSLDAPSVGPIVPVTTSCGCTNGCKAPTCQNL